MKVPTRITPSWLDGKGYELRLIYADGLRPALITKVGRKNVKAYTFKQFVNKSSSIYKPAKVTMQEYRNAQPLVYEKRKWKVAA